MSTDLSQRVARQMRTMPIEDQQKVAAFVEGLAGKPISIIDRIAARSAKLSKETLERLPEDGAENLDHYLYGHDKKSK
ncbi:MAG TPA: hypothetical protein PLK77_17415 [Pyrinomonadaceae bacterium]|nr:hypothetical protein [Pyrinomonadaceae bacterium]